MNSLLIYLLNLDMY